MEKNSKPDFTARCRQYESEGKIHKRACEALLGFYKSYRQALGSSWDDACAKTFDLFLVLIAEQVNNSYEFPPYHVRIREPLDYYAFGLDFIRRLVIKDESSFSGREYMDEVEEHLKQGHNVVFLANHQIEGDPQAISLLLEDTHPDIGEEMIFLAGERVLTDPVAIPFSMGRNILCIYSKRYIDHPPERKVEKQNHNKKAMQLLSALLSEGGKTIYVAPSGGRDRRGPSGEVELAPFDPKSIEMLYLMAQKAGHPTYFYPMALGTYTILPPPETIQIELGEARPTGRGGIHMGIGPAIDMESFPGSAESNKALRRKARADYIWDLVHTLYNQFPR